MVATRIAWLLAFFAIKHVSTSPVSVALGDLTSSFEEPLKSDMARRGMDTMGLSIQKMYAINTSLTAPPSQKHLQETLPALENASLDDLQSGLRTGEQSIITHGRDYI